jgi:hypothetical protein
MERYRLTSPVKKPTIKKTTTFSIIKGGTPPAECNSRGAGSKMDLFIGEESDRVILLELEMSEKNLWSHMYGSH